MTPSSTDVRHKIVQASERRLGSQRALAALCGVSRSFIEKLLRRRRTPGGLAPQPPAGGPKPRRAPSPQARREQWGHEPPEVPLDALCTRVAEATGRRVSVPPRCRVRQRRGLARKNRRATRRSGPPHAASKRAASQAVIDPLPLARVTFSDASGRHLALPRLVGRAPRGERVVDAVPRHSGPHVPILAALALQGSDAVMTGAGATAAEVLRAYVEQGLGPTLRPGEVVGRENRSAQKVHGMRDGIEGTGAQLLSLPPYWPALSPLEPCWSNLKAAVRAAKARPRQAREAALGDAREMVTDADARGWFAHGG